MIQPHGTQGDRHRHGRQGAHCQPRTWTSSGITFGYQWYVGLKAVTGATQQTFKVPARAVGKQVRFKVTASRPGARSVSKYSSWTRAVTKASFVFSAPPTLSPETTVGQTVSVLPATLVPDSDTVSYAWYRGTTRILGAAGDSYVLKAADQGRYITVRDQTRPTRLQHRDQDVEDRSSDFVGPAASRVAPCCHFRCSSSRRGRRGCAR